MTNAPHPTALARALPRPSADFSGILVACVCACHCSALPFLLTSSPAIARWIGDPRLELLFLASALGIGLFAFGRGARGGHGRLRPASVFVLGFAILLAGRVLESHELAGGTLTMIAGSLAIALAHADNWRLARRATEEQRSAACCDHAEEGIAPAPLGA